jgi:hypothetical protein
LTGALFILISRDSVTIQTDFRKMTESNYMSGHFTLGEPKLSISHLLYHCMEKKEKVIISDAGFNEIYLVKNDGYQTIYCSQSALRIFIYLVTDATVRRFDFYAFIEDDLTGFVTENMTGFDEFYQALEWYSRYINQPFFKLLKENPLG